MCDINRHSFNSELQAVTREPPRRDPPAMGLGKHASKAAKKAYAWRLKPPRCLLQSAADGLMKNDRCHREAHHETLRLAMSL